MTVKIPIEVPPELVKEVHSLDDETVKARCTEEIEKHVSYLEMVLKGWKTYKNAKEGHGRVLYLMLKAENKDSLREYEKQVLYPKMLEREKIERIVREELQKRAEAEVVGKVANLGAEQSSSDSPIIGYDNNGKQFVYDRIEIDDYEDEHSLRDHDYRKPHKKNGKKSKASGSSEKVTTVTNYSSFEAIPEDDTVHGVEYNFKMSENIALATRQVREALDNIDLMKADCPHFEQNDATRRDLLALETKLIQSATEVAQAMEAVPEWKTNPNLSKGMVKRMKKAAKKAAEATEARRLEALQELERLRHVQLAADAIEMLNAKALLAPPPGLEHVGEKKKDPFSEDTLPDIPLSEEELKVLMKIWNRSEEIEPASEEQRIFEIYKENSQLIEEYILRNTNLAAMKNRHYVQQLTELNADILGFTGRTQISRDEELAQAKEYIAKKKLYWETEGGPQSPYFVQMYNYFQDNMGYRIAGIITGYMPIEADPDAKFEETLLLQFQTGKFFDMNDEELKPLPC